MFQHGNETFGYIIILPDKLRILLLTLQALRGAKFLAVGLLLEDVFRRRALCERLSSQSVREGVRRSETAAFSIGRGKRLSVALHKTWHFYRLKIVLPASVNSTISLPFVAKTVTPSEMLGLLTSQSVFALSLSKENFREIYKLPTHPSFDNTLLSSFTSSLEYEVLKIILRKKN